MCETHYSSDKKLMPLHIKWLEIMLFKEGHMLFVNLTWEKVTNSI